MRELPLSMEQAVQAAKGSFENPQLSGAELRPLLSKAPDDLNLQLFTYYLLHTTYCLLLTASYLPLTADY